MAGDSILPGVRGRVEDRLESFLEDKRTEARKASPQSVELVEAIAALTMRGGKRLRPQVVAAGYLAVKPDGGVETTVDVGAAIEMLQSYLLIHDDWMDQDDERRGGPSVYAALRERHRDEHLGASLAVLAGDLAAAYATELLVAAPYPHGRRADAMLAFLQLQREVFFGQHLDLLATEDVERMYDLKTGSYTVRGPLRLGALLADAQQSQLAALDRIAWPLGIAFQLRDELLGTFGDPSVTGKPAGNDIRSGKLTVLVTRGRSLADDAQRAALDAAFGRPDASDDEVAAAAEALEAAGARRDVERRLEGLLARARDALDGAPLEVAPLRTLAERLAIRDH